MKYLQIILLAALTILTNCQQNKPDEKVTHDSIKMVTSQPFIDGKFKYGHVESFTPGIFKNDSLVLIDSLFHSVVISQIDGYTFPFSDKPKNYFISKQNDINDLTAMTVSLYWDVCYEGVILLMLDKQNKLINSMTLTEWYSSCDSYSNTETTFLTDSTFIQHITVIEPGGESDSVTELKFKGSIKSSGQMDTLEILVNRKYEQ